MSQYIQEAIQQIDNLLSSQSNGTTHHTAPQISSKKSGASRTLHVLTWQNRLGIHLMQSVLAAGSAGRSGSMAKPKGKQPAEKQSAVTTTAKAAPPAKDSVLLPARLQSDGAGPSGAVPSLRAELAAAFKQALDAAYPAADAEPVVAQTNEPKFGDYQCNNAMALFGQLKGKVCAACLRTKSRSIQRWQRCTCTRCSLHLVHVKACSDMLPKAVAPVSTLCPSGALSASIGCC